MTTIIEEVIEVAAPTTIVIEPTQVEKDLQFMLDQVKRGYWARNVAHTTPNVAACVAGLAMQASMQR